MGRPSEWKERRDLDGGEEREVEDVTRKTQLRPLVQHVLLRVTLEEMITCNDENRHCGSELVVTCSCSSLLSNNTPR